MLAIVLYLVSLLAGFLVGIAVTKRIPTEVLRKLVGGQCCGLGLFLLLRLLLS